MVKDYIRKIRNKKVNLSDMIVWFFVLFSVLCVASFFVNILFFKQTPGGAVLSSGNFIVSFVMAVILPAALILTITSKFIANKDEGLTRKNDVVLWAKQVGEHIRNSEYPEEFIKTFFPLISNILAGLNEATPDIPKLVSSSNKIFEIVDQDGDFKENWMGQELLHLVYLVRSYLDYLGKVN